MMRHYRNAFLGFVMILLINTLPCPVMAEPILLQGDVDIMNCGQWPAEMMFTPAGSRLVIDGKNYRILMVLGVPRNPVLFEQCCEPGRKSKRRVRLLGELYQDKRWGTAIKFIAWKDERLAQSQQTAAAETTTHSYSPLEMTRLRQEFYDRIFMARDDAQSSSKTRQERALKTMNGILADPKLPEKLLPFAHLARGEAYFSLGDYKKAFADYDRVVALEKNQDKVGPYTTQAYRTKVNNWIKKGTIADLRQGIGEVETILARVPDDTLMRSNLKNLKWELRDREKQEANRKIARENRRQADTLEAELKKRAAAIRAGKMNIGSMDDALAALRPYGDTSIMCSPPIDGPTRKGLYYAFHEVLTAKQGGVYICWNPFRRCGVAFRNIAGKFSELRTKQQTFVVGKYRTTYAFTLVSGIRAYVPLLEDCYVSQAWPSDAALRFVR